MRRVAEQALSDALQISYKSANARLANTLYQFVESVLTQMTHKGAKDELFDICIERWTQSSTFRDAFAKHALTSLRFVRPVAKLICKIKRDQGDEK